MVVEIKDSLEFLSGQKDFENDIIFCDPPYALGSEVIGGLKAGYHNWTACEINPEYVNIAKERIVFFQQYFRKDE